MLAGLGRCEGSGERMCPISLSLACRCLSSSSQSSLLVCMIIQTSLFYKDTNHIELGTHSSPVRCYCSVTKSCLTLCDSMDCGAPNVPALHCYLEFIQMHCTESVMLSNHLILCHPPLLLPSIIPSSRVFSNKLALCIRWSRD